MHFKYFNFLGWMNPPECNSAIPCWAISSCLNGGSCLTEGDSFRCICPVNYSGVQCEYSNPLSEEESRIFNELEQNANTISHVINDSNSFTGSVDNKEFNNSIEEYEGPKYFTAIKNQTLLQDSTEFSLFSNSSGSKNKLNSELDLFSSPETKDPAPGSTEAIHSQETSTRNIFSQLLQTSNTSARKNTLDIITTPRYGFSSSTFMQVSYIIFMNLIVA